MYDVIYMDFAMVYYYIIPLKCSQAYVFFVIFSFRFIYLFIFILGSSNVSHISGRPPNMWAAHTFFLWAARRSQAHTFV